MENLTILLITIVGLIIYLCNRRLSYFKSRNIPYLKSVPFLGALSDSIIGRKGIYDCVEEIYKTPEFKNEKLFGIFLFHKPALLIKDPEIIKQILVKDFNSFINHIAGTGDHDPVGNASIFLSKDSFWKNLRKRLTPFFSSGKMKSMFPVLDKISDNLINHLEESSSGNSLEVDIRQKLCLFTTDVISSVAFGVDANALKNPLADFAKLSRRMFTFTFHRGLELTSVFLLPEITKLFNFKTFTSEGTDFLSRSITHVMKERKESKMNRNDLIDTLIELGDGSKDEKPLEEDVLVGQAAMFFSAGHETSAGTATFVLYELAKHQNIQARVRSEIMEALKKTDGKLTYDVIMSDTPYLQQVLIETLRLFPVLPLLDRVCSNPNGYSLKPYSDFVIPYKFPVIIPIYGIQRDEKYFPNPLKFDPERFSPENVGNVNTFTNIPFGIGNRNCIGERFGLMQSKTAVAKILLNYRIEMTPETPREIKLTKNAFISQSEVPIILKLVKV